MIILTTDRLIIREFDISDAKAMFDLNSDKEVLKYTGDVAFESVGKTKDFLSNYPDYEKNGFGRWIVELKGTNEILGWCGLKKHEDGKVDIGYRFYQKEWGKGYATEAARACLEYGFELLELEEILGNSAIENKKSIRVFDKLGMKFIENKTCDGIEDAVRYRISKNEFLK
ncbi:MAG: GNAT family N-acetyltransferase [Flavobacteriales bacterium]